MKVKTFSKIAVYFKNFAPMRTVIVAALLLFTANANSYTGYKQFSDLPEPLPTSKGELIYKEMGCVMCHGIQGDGNGFLAEGLNPKPRDFTDYKVMSRVPDQSIMDAVNNGILGTAMPSFNLSEDQVQDLTSYLRSFLAETYLTVNACLMDTQIVDTNVDTANFKVQVENPDLINVKKEGTLLYITPNLLKAKNSLSSKKVTRTHIILAQNQTNPSETEKYLSLIAVRVHKCFR